MTVQQFAANVDRLTDADEWRSAHPQPKNVNDQFQSSFSTLERVAIRVTDRVRTMGFFLAIAVWTVVWLGWNTFGPEGSRFDPGPAFVLWLFISNLIQIHLMPLIMVGQNLQGRHSELRAEADFEVNQKAEAEIETVLQHLSQQNDLMLEILKRLERIDTARGGAAG